jgi:hypothetical protein
MPSSAFPCRSVSHPHPRCTCGTWKRHSMYAARCVPYICLCATLWCVGSAAWVRVCVCVCVCVCACCCAQTQNPSHTNAYCRARRTHLHHVCVRKWVCVHARVCVC